MTRTYSPKAAEISKDWLVIDASDVVLGKLASHTAALLRGKHKATFANHIDTGDFVIIVNAEKIVLSGAKLADKKVYHHSGFPGGIKTTNYGDLIEQNPEKAIIRAVRGMLPKNSLGRQQIKKLKVYRGAEHPHKAQQPKPYTISQIAQ